jgi:hypothetical protein
MEKMLMAIESEILTLNLKNALELAVNMKLNEASVKDKSVFSVIKAIRQDIEEKVGNLTDGEAIKGYLDGIKAFLGPPPLEQAFLSPPPLEDKETLENKEISEDEKEFIELEQQIEQLLGKKNEIDEQSQLVVMKAVTRPFMKERDAAVKNVKGKVCPIPVTTVSFVVGRTTLPVTAV